MISCLKSCRAYLPSVELGGIVRNVSDNCVNVATYRLLSDSSNNFGIRALFKCRVERSVPNYVLNLEKSKFGDFILAFGECITLRFHVEFGHKFLCSLGLRYEVAHTT